MLIAVAIVTLSDEEAYGYAIVKTIHKSLRTDIQAGAVYVSISRMYEMELLDRTIATVASANDSKITYCYTLTDKCTKLMRETDEVYRKVALTLACASKQKRKK